MNFLNQNIINVPLQIINFFCVSEYNIKKIKEHNLFDVVELIKKDNVDIFSYDFLNYFQKKNLKESFDIIELEYDIKSYKSYYSNSISNNKIFENRKDPIILFRVKKEHENILAIQSGTFRFFLAKLLNIEKIPVVIIDKTNNNDYKFI